MLGLEKDERIAHLDLIHLLGVGQQDLDTRYQFAGLIELPHEISSALRIGSETPELLLEVVGARFAGGGTPSMALKQRQAPCSRCLVGVRPEVSCCRLVPPARNLPRLLTCGATTRIPMKLLRYGPIDHEKPGLLDAAGCLRDLSSVVPDLAGEVLSKAGLARIAALDPFALPAVPGQPRLGPCVAGTQTFIGIGLNYFDHAAEVGAKVPSEPIFFLKATSSICGANDELRIPRGSTKTDWEVELGVVIGETARYVSEAEALDHVAGYCAVNDVSERAFQIERQGQWTKGKSADTFGPLGPWLVTADEVRDPQRLRLWLEVNGVRRQEGTTETMVFGVRTLIAYVSQFLTLRPGDVITTGTPPGVGMGMKPPVFLRAGDVVTLGVGGLGTQCHIAVQG